MDGITARALKNECVHGRMVYALRDAHMHGHVDAWFTREVMVYALTVAMRFNFNSFRAPAYPGRAWDFESQS